MQFLAAVSLAALASCAVAEAPDTVAELPGYGAPQTRQFSGFSDATLDGSNRLFYWFIEADVGSRSTETPILIWLNGGPGASSMVGLLNENLGPQKMTANSRLVDNPHRITKRYHLLAVDNPVGAGFSITKTGAYVRSEEEMRKQFVHALRGFYKLHPEYNENPLWLTGESYAGKYVPNIAYELSVNAKEIPFKGIIVGNGLYNERAQYSTIGDMAFGAGIIDGNLLKEVHLREQKCLEEIEKGSPVAGDFCENVTVRWLYTGPDAAAGDFFYYDIGIADANELDNMEVYLGNYLNRPEVKDALHVDGDVTWTCADETGPVAEALRSDFTRPSAPVVEALLGLGKEVVLFNGVRDASVCNHIANLKAVLNMTWSGSADFKAAENKPWPSVGNVMGHMRAARNLRFATVLRTGHLVPLIAPESFATLLAMILEPTGAGQATLVV